MPNQRLPEGTDHIIDGDGHEAASDINIAADDAETAELIDDITLEQKQERQQQDSGGYDDLRGAFFGKFDALRGQATDRAFGLAQDGKDRATAALDDIARTVEDAAAEIDARIGTQYGDYARRAAESISGFSDSFKGKDVDALFAEARDLVKKSPAVAIGAAAALGFVVARLVKAGIPGTEDGSRDKGDGPDGSAA